MAFDLILMGMGLAVDLILIALVGFRLDFNLILIGCWFDSNWARMGFLLGCWLGFLF